VAIFGRTKSGQRWYEPLVVNTDKFQFRMNPWVAQRPDSVENAGFDLTRYNVPFWQKCERMLRHTRDKGIVVSIIFYVDGKDPGVDPFGKARMGGEEEQRYYRYTLARLAAFSNAMWDLANEYRFFRDDAWAEKMGTLIKTYDPYQHLTSIHGHADFRFRSSPWADFAMYQNWDEGGGHGFMLKNRRAQVETGRPIPQINEEYGYEDHYPARWGGGRKSPARSADNRRRLAWGMYMAGGCQTTGERADRGTGGGPDTGGGWINGRGDDTMTMLEGYGHIVTCFTSLRWWKMEPRDDLVSKGRYCLGLDYTFAYCWHVQGNPSPQQAIAAQLDSINKTRRLGILPQVVTVSQGWSGWRDEGSIWKIPPAQYKELLEKAKAVIRTFPATQLGSRMILLDNWNEWSEGHYLAPHREYGFGYLDAVREVFSDAPKDHVDLLPKDMGMGPYDQAYKRQVGPRK
jgi:hypothetical protein